MPRTRFTPNVTVTMQTTQQAATFHVNPPLTLIYPAKSSTRSFSLPNFLSFEPFCARAFSLHRRRFFIEYPKVVISEAILFIQLIYTL